MGSEELDKARKDEARRLIRTWSRINHVETAMEDIYLKMPWANAVWLQCRNDGWVAFVRADMGGYSTEPCKTAIEAVTELWMYYSERGWKQAKETGK